MCGIAGLVRSPGEHVDAAALKRMADALAHRGPDGEGCFVAPAPFAHVGLAHRRLAVLDIAHGGQPMRDAATGITVVFNGQIYNHAALRRELTQLGGRFASDHSDTEVIVQGARIWGSALWSRLDGMYAIAVVDERHATLTLARDRIGKKPLYVATPPFFGGQPLLAFASELSALVTLDEAVLDVDVAALARYLHLHFVPDPDAMLVGVRKLLPGHTLTVPLLQPSSWMALASIKARVLQLHTVEVPHTAPERAAALTEHLTQATEARLLADVDVGAWLSGGLDSSLVCALAVKKRPRLRTFSVGFDVSAFDESEHALAVARHLSTRHHHVVMRSDEAELAATVALASLAEPLADASHVATLMLAQATHQHEKVVLSGDGGDELFWGYPNFRLERLRTDVAARLPASVKGAVRQALARLQEQPFHLGNSSHSDWDWRLVLTRLQQGMGEGDVAHRHQTFLSGPTGTIVDLLAAAHKTAGAMALAGHDDTTIAGSSSNTDALTAMFMRRYLAGGVLVKVDRASMAYGVEVRSPLLDDAVVDFALSLPDDDKAGWFSGKRLLKQVAAPLLPKAIIDRKKKGFGVPMAAWLNGPLRSLADDHLSALRDAPWLDARVVQRLLLAHRQGAADHRQVLWALIVFSSWWQRMFHARRRS